MKIKQKRLSKKYLAIGAVLLIVVAGVAAYVVSRPADRAASTTVKNGIKYAPATKEELQQAQDAKERVLERDKLENSASQGETRTVTPVISYVGQSGQTVQANAYIAGTVENGGTCRLTLTRDDRTVTASSTGAADATTTNCPTMTFDRSDLSAGSWQAILSYSSGTAEGTSAPVTVEVE